MTASSGGPTRTTGSETTPCRLMFTTNSSAIRRAASCQPKGRPARLIAAPSSVTETRRSRCTTRRRTASPGRKLSSASTTLSLRSGVWTVMPIRGGPPRGLCGPDPGLAVLPFALPQHELLDLPGRGFRQRPELDGIRALVMREPLAAERDDLLCGRARPRLQSYEGLGSLAPVIVRNPHDRTLEDRRVRRDRLLHLDAGDVLAAGDDDVLAAVAQLDVAVRVPDRQVARVKPAPAERSVGGRLVGEVAAHHVVAPHQHLAHRLAILGDIAHLLIDNPNQVGSRIPLALPGEELGSLCDGQLMPRLLSRADRDRTVGLGQAVDVDDPEVQLGHPREQRR